MNRKNTSASQATQHEPDRWMVRECIHNLATDKETKNIRVCQELVWGHWVYPRGNQGNPRIVGESYHELHGPTAAASLSSYAEELNFRKVTPDTFPKDLKMGRQPKNDPAQLGLMLMMTPNFKVA